MIEANASLRTLVHRNTEQAYWEYVKELAAQEGVDPEGGSVAFTPGPRSSSLFFRPFSEPKALLETTAFSNSLLACFCVWYLSSTSPSGETPLRQTKHRIKRLWRLASYL